MKVSDSSRSRRLLGLFALPLIVFLLFSSTNFDGTWILDDYYQVKQNPFIQKTEYIPRILKTRLWKSTAYNQATTDMYRPVFLLSYMLDYHLFGLNPIGYHLHNNFLHSINVLLLFVLASMFLSWKLAAFISLFFGIHPIGIEAITWVGGRMDLLVTFFALIHFLALLYLLKNPSKSKFKNGFLWIVYSTSIVLGLGSKEVFALIPFLGIGVFIFASSNQIRNLKIAFLVSTSLTATYMFWRASIVERSLVSYLDWVNFTNLNNLIQRFFALLVFPADSEFGALYENVTFHFFPDFIVFSILVVGICVLVYRFRNSLPVLLGLAIFLAPLIPISLTLDMTRIMGERYFYLPATGFSLMLGGIGSDSVFGKLKTSSIWPWLQAGSLLWLCVLALQTGIRNRDWSTEERLYQATLTKNERNYRAYYELAMAGQRAGNQFYEISFYYKTLSINPNHMESLNNLAVRMIEWRQFDKAKQFLDHAFSLNPNRPKTAYNFGFYYESLHQPKKAIYWYQQAVGKKPSYTKAKQALRRLQKEE